MNHQMIALHAVTSHGIYHRLPAPATITFSDTTVRLYVGADGDGWIETLHVDDHRCETPTPKGWVRTCVRGRLPDLGVRVEVWFWTKLHGSDA